MVKSPIKEKKKDRKQGWKAEFIGLQP